MARPRVKVTLTKADLGHRLKAARIRRGFTQAKLAALLDVTQARVSDIERGARKPSLQQLARLSRALKVPVDELLTGQIGGTNGQDQDHRFVRRIEEIAQLPERDKQVLLRTIDTFLKASRAH